jgi:CRP/FNR family cyclic AMP-dependent transcriptional regulator
VDAQRLSRLDLFRSLNKRDLARVAAWTDEIDVEAGTVLGREGTYAYEFFVIEEGSATVAVDGETVAELGPDEWFGEIGIIESDRRTATVTAKTPMRLAVIFAPDFRTMTRQLPDLYAAIRAEMRERLARAS